MNSAYLVSLGTKFQIKLTVLIFWTKSPQKVPKKGISQSKTQKVNITFEFFVLDLA